MLIKFWHSLNQRSLSVQIIFSFVIIIIFTAFAVGLPAIWLIRNQSEMQAWAQVEQGSRATRSLLIATQKEVNGLALLTAQRPLIPELIAQNNITDLQIFLNTLREGTDLDLLLICDSSQKPVISVGDLVESNLCLQTTVPGYYINPESDGRRMWILGIEPIESTAELSNYVIVGIALDNTFASELRSQTGLEHTLLVNNEIVASSLPLDAARTASTQLNGENENAIIRTILRLDGKPYYAALLQLDQPAIVDEVALQVSNITVTQQRLVNLMVGSIIAAMIVGSLLGVFLARRISWPLRQLTQAAMALSTGDMDTAVAVNSQVQEVTMVAQALEKSRTDLQKLLTELRQTNAWNDHLLKSISEGIVVLDENGRITLFSPGAVRISGFAQEDALGRSTDAIFHLAETDEPFSHFLPQPGHPYKVTLKRVDERLITVAVTAATLSLPSIGKAGVALVFRDISDNERIHHLLGQFLANITHEFRTPLSALAASTELLIDQAEDLTTAELQELLNSLHLGVLGLQTLIDNLLESASLEAGRFRVYPKPINVRSIILEAATTMKPLQIKYSQRIHLELADTLPQVQADPRRTTQVVVNLLSNAIKYSPDGSEISVTAVVTDGFVRVDVADRGPGVPPGYRPDLFRRLAHPGLESSKAQYGVGLGLSVVKAIVEAQGGQVGVEDQSGGGSIFWFTIPKVREL
ncbi:MAG: PAS domain S-box protein [Anaerolineales bacterium]|nr:PAS domain S-box protein [Anaerolineales bacterium]